MLYGVLGDIHTRFDRGEDGHLVDGGRNLGRDDRVENADRAFLAGQLVVDDLVTQQQRHHGRRSRLRMLFHAELPRFAYHTPFAAKL